MWWKTVLQVAIALGLDKWAKAKARKLADKLRKKAEKKAEKIEELLIEKVKAVLGEDESGNKVVVETLPDGTVKVRRVR